MTNDDKSLLDDLWDQASPEKQQKEYDDNSIQTLDPLAHIRQRPGMYVGNLGDGSESNDALYTMFKEVVDNSIDEYVMGFGRRIDITVKPREIIVRDYGRGIPLGKLVECVSNINTGGKFKQDGYQFAVGMNGVGTKAVNALSSEFEVTSWRDGKCHTALFHEGVLDHDAYIDPGSEHTGTLVRFVPDSKLFPNYSIRLSEIENRIWMYAYVNTGLSFYLNGQKINSKNGLLDLVLSKVDEGAPLYKPVHCKDASIELAFCHVADIGEQYYSFANGQYTRDGGTHLSAFKGGITRAINEHFNKNFEPKDIRDGIVGAVAIKSQKVDFESQTKNKLTFTSDMRSTENAIKLAVIDYLLKHPDDAKLLLEKIQRNEQARLDIQQVQKKCSKTIKHLSLRNEKLHDCRHHLGDRSKYANESMIFLTEGNSAASSIVHSRDPEYQAVFALRGKPLNSYGMRLEATYANDELFYVVRTLGIEEDVDGLKYAKIVIATDADVDGLHIRNLLLTFFLQYFMPLVLSGHLYIFETPLFRVRNTKTTFYCYSEQERDEKAKELGGNVEITRFKGLGEISPDEFKQFVGPDIHLGQVVVENPKDIHGILRRCMGGNDKDRWKHIQDNLI